MVIRDYLMNFWVVRAEFGKHADAFRNGGYVALDFDISEPTRDASIHFDILLYRGKIL